MSTKENDDFNELDCIEGDKNFNIDRGRPSYPQTDKYAGKQSTFRSEDAGLYWLIIMIVICVIWNQCTGNNHDDKTSPFSIEAPTKR